MYNTLANYTYSQERLYESRYVLNMASFHIFIASRFREFVFFFSLSSSSSFVFANDFAVCSQKPDALLCHFYFVSFFFYSIALSVLLLFCLRVHCTDSIFFFFSSKKRNKWNNCLPLTRKCGIFLKSHAVVIKFANLIADLRVCICVTFTSITVRSECCHYEFGFVGIKLII